MDIIVETLDPCVVPMVQFFNENGLKTSMSCQGHNNTNLSMFWISFAKEVTEDDIVHFMQNHLDLRGQFTSCGRFAKRIFGGYSVEDQLWKTMECWCYFAATVDAAEEDLSRWKRPNAWKGFNDPRYIAWQETLKNMKRA